MVLEKRNKQKKLRKKNQFFPLDYFDFKIFVLQKWKKRRMCKKNYYWLCILKFKCDIFFCAKRRDDKKRNDDLRYGGKKVNRFSKFHLNNLYLATHQSPPWKNPSQTPLLRIEISSLTKKKWNLVFIMERAQPYFKQTNIHTI